MEKTVEELLEKTNNKIEEINSAINEVKDLQITFEDIQKANETINTTNIKGKDYAEVNQRIKAFRMVYPQGTIETKMIQDENGICIFRAYIYSEPTTYINQTIDGATSVNMEQRGQLLASGTAYEKENSTFINKTSYIENCETSAVGRALGMAGFGIDTSVASAEEVQNAIANQKGDFTDMPIQEGQKQRINAQLTEEEMKKALKHFKVKSIDELNFVQAKNILDMKEKKVD